MLFVGDFVRDNLPEVITQINLLGQRREAVEALRDGVYTNLSRLREQIELARDAANRVSMREKSVNCLCKINLYDIFIVCVIEMQY